MSIYIYIIHMYIYIYICIYYTYVYILHMYIYIYIIQSEAYKKTFKNRNHSIFTLWSLWSLWSPWSIPATREKLLVVALRHPGTSQGGTDDAEEGAHEEVREAPGEIGAWSGHCDVFRMKPNCAAPSLVMWILWMLLELNPVNTIYSYKMISVS